MTRETETGPTPTRAVIALGSNLGGREETLAAAVDALAATAGVEVVAVSPFIETVAITPQGADDSAPAYLNGVALIDTTLDPFALLAAIGRIENELGRVRGERWADRTIDLDIIAFGDLQLATEALTIPHPRAAERDFVLRPWLDVDPDATLPGVGRVDALREVVQ